VLAITYCGKHDLGGESKLPGLKVMESAISFWSVGRRDRAKDVADTPQQMGNLMTVLGMNLRLGARFWQRIEDAMA